MTCEIHKKANNLQLEKIGKNNRTEKDLSSAAASGSKCNGTLLWKMPCMRVLWGLTDFRDDRVSCVSYESCQGFLIGESHIL